MTKTDKLRRRAARKAKGTGRLERQTRKQARDEREEDRRTETLRAERQKWADCAFHGKSVKKPGEILCLNGFDTFLTLELKDEAIRVLACTECGGEWWHITVHP